jgi:hypothetical protein
MNRADRPIRDPWRGAAPLPWRWLLVSVGLHAAAFWLLAGMHAPPAPADGERLALDPQPAPAQAPAAAERNWPGVESATISPERIAAEAVALGAAAPPPGVAAAGPDEPSLPAPEPVVALPVDVWTSPALGAALKPWPPRFAQRRGGRDKLAARDNKPAADAIELGLEWLRKHQDEDGRFDAAGFMKHDRGERTTGPGRPVHDVGVTGLVLLAFTADGQTLTTGRYRDCVRRAAWWLCLQQDEESGRLGPDLAHDFIYDHAIGTLALVETFGLSHSSLLRPYAQKAVDYLEAHRNQGGVWRYRPRDGEQDTSVTGWCALANLAALEFGLRVEPAATVATLAWFTQVTDPYTGRAGYLQRGEPSARRSAEHGERFPREHGEALTALALWCRLMLGQDPRAPALQAAAQTVLARPPRWDPEHGTVDAYYWYHATHALHWIGGKAWDEWHRKLQPALLQGQRTDGNFAGSFDPVDVWGQDGGRVATTAMLVLTLQAQYRYTRVR